MMRVLLAALQIVLPDQAHLVHLADSAGLPPAVVEAIAWQESGVNLSPTLRGHHCWWSTRVGETLTIHHERDCEVGRFQIKPSTGRARCPGLNIWVYDGNTHCFVTMFAADVRQYGLTAAIKRHNGSGRVADEYVERVYATVGRLLTQEEQ